MLARSSSSLALAAGVLVGAAGIALFFGLRIATGGSELAASGDTLLYYYPQYAAAGAALREGQLPLWNPYQLNGHPWLATLQGGILYPFHLVYAWQPTHTGMAASALLHLLIAAAGMAALARRLKLVGWAALLGAILIATQGRLPEHAGVPNLLEAGAWLAPGAVGVVDIARGRFRWAVPLLAASLGLSLLAGYPQYTVYCCYAWAALLAVVLVGDARPLRDWRSPAAGFALAIVLGVLLGSPQLLASFELSALSTRTLGAASYSQMFPMGWPKDSLVESFRFLAPGRATFSFFGVTGLALLPFALLSPARRLAFALLALSLIVFGMALGPASPLFEIYRLLPGVGSFRLPTQRLMLVVGFLFVLLAAIGLDAILRLLRARFGPGVAVAFGVAVVGVALLEPFLDDHPRPELPYSGRGYEEIYERRQEMFDEVTSDSARVLLWNPGIPPKLPSKLGALFGMRVFDDYEPMSLQRQSEYFSYLSRGVVSDPQAPPFFGRLLLPLTREEIAGFASRKRLLDLAAVKWILAANVQRNDATLHALGQALGFTREPKREKLWEVSPVLYVNERALPRAYVSYRTRPAPEAAELLPLLAADDFDPLHTSYVEGGPELGGEAPAGRRGHPVRIVRDEATEVELAATLVADGLVVLADTVYPGWEATVDGDPVEVFATNHLFRGVPVPAGEHIVRFRYVPSWAAPALLGSILGVAGVFAVCAWRPRQRQSRSARSTLPA